MSLAVPLLAVLLLQPVLDDPGSIRLVAAGVGDQSVVWHVGDATVGVTSDRQPWYVEVPAGRSFVWVEGPDESSWTALARPDPASGGATYVPAAWAVHRPEPPPTGQHGPRSGVFAVGLVAASAIAAVAARRR